MSKLDQEDYRGIGEEIARALGADKRGGPPPAGSSASAPSGMMDAFNMLYGGVKNTTTSLISLTTGSYNAGSALTDFSKLTGVLGPVGGAVGDLTKTLGTGAIDIAKSMQDSGKYGINMNNNMGLYIQGLGDARIGMAEWNQMLKQNAGSVQNLALGQDRSALAYLGLSKKLQETDIVAAMQRVGFETEEWTKVLNLSTVNRKNLDMSSASAQRSVVDTAVRMGVEFDNIAKLTGKSVAAQQKDMEQQLSKVEVQAKMLAMSKEEQEAFLTTQATLNKFGPAFQNVYTELATGGIRTESGNLTASIMNPQILAAMTELVEINKNPNSPGNKERADQLQAQIAELKARENTDKDRLNQIAVMATAGGKQGEEMARQFQGDKTRDMDQQVQIRRLEMQEKLGRPVTFEEVKNIILEEQRKNRESLRPGAVVGGGTEGAAGAVAQTVYTADRTIKDASAGLGRGFNDLNTETGKLVKNMSNLNTLLQPRKAEAFDKEAIIKSLKSELGFTGRTLTPETTPAMKPLKPEDGRADGSFGAVGKFMEDFGAGTPMMLHGKEGVITEKQFNGLFGDLGKQMTGAMPDPKQMQGMLGGITGNLKGDLEKAKGTMPTTETFEKMFSQMKMPDMGEITRSISGSMPTAPTNTGSEAMNDVAKGVNELNMRIERLITAVTDGSDKSIRALKSKGNMVA